MRGAHGDDQQGKMAGLRQGKLPEGTPELRSEQAERAEWPVMWQMKGDPMWETQGLHSGVRTGPRSMAVLHSGSQREQATPAGVASEGLHSGDVIANYLPCWGDERKSG
jgi:hypothetical protein